MSNGKNWNEDKKPIQVWFTLEEHEMIQRAADADHRTLSSFIRAHVLPAAEEAVEDKEEKPHPA